MPIYEYKCRKCNKEFEAVQLFTDEPLKTCRFCKGPVTKLMSLSSFHLKGAGWYVTDYGGKKPSIDTKGEVKTESKSESADSPKADWKSSS
jgi:putative FmdB family regulatory protein